MHSNTYATLTPSPPKHSQLFQLPLNPGVREINKNLKSLHEIKAFAKYFSWISATGPCHLDLKYNEDTPKTHQPPNPTSHKTRRF